MLSMCAGVVEFDDLEVGEYVVQYCRERRLIYAETASSITVYPSCRYNCSFPRGSCYRVSASEPMV